MDAGWPPNGGEHARGLLAGACVVARAAARALHAASFPSCAPRGRRVFPRFDPGRHGPLHPVHTWHNIFYLVRVRGVIEETIRSRNRDLVASGVHPAGWRAVLSGGLRGRVDWPQFGRVLWHSPGPKIGPYGSILARFRDTRVRCRNNGCGVAAKRWRARAPCTTKLHLFGQLKRITRGDIQLHCNDLLQYLVQFSGLYSSRQVQGQNTRKDRPVASTDLSR